MFTPQVPVVVPQPSAPQQLQLNVPATPVDLEYAQDLIEQVNDREDSLAKLQTQMVKYVKKTMQPAIDIDPMMLPYMEGEYRQPVTFPDSIPTTALQQYFIFVPESDSAPDTTVINVSTASLQLPVKAEVIRPTMPSQARIAGYPYSSVTVSLVVMLIFFTWLKFHFGSSLSNSIRAFFNYQQTRRIQEEQKELDRQAIFYTNLFSFLVTGIFISFAIPMFGIGLFGDSYLLTAGVCSLAAALLLFVNIGIWLFFGNIFLIQPVVKEYVYNLYLFNRDQGLFIFPLALVFPFLSNGLGMIYVIASAFGLVYFMRIFRFFQIIHAKKVPSFYFILYLCTLEFLPIIVLIKACVSVVA